MRSKVLIALGIFVCFSCARAEAADTAIASCPIGEGYVYLYDSPDGFQVNDYIRCGAKLEVLDAPRNGRTHVRTAEGKEGYVTPSSLVAAPAPSSPSNPPATSNPPAPASSLTTPSAPVDTPAPVASAPVTPAPVTPAPAAPAPVKTATQMSEAPPSPAHVRSSTDQPQKHAKVEKVKADKTEKTEKAEKTQKTAEQKPVAATPPPAASAFVPFSTLGYGYDVPRMEFSAGYSFMNTGTSGLTNRENMSGVEGSVTYNLTRRYAAEANVGAYFKTLQITNLGTFGFHDYTAMGGGRVNIRKAFAHALVGLDHISGSNTFFAAGSSASDNALAAAVGGGVQWSISPRMALRTSGDYVVSRFEGLTQNNIRLSFGLVFQSGSIYGRRGE